jgi:ribosomal protein RSM22 (predicted rRNA methylase)
MNLAEILPHLLYTFPHESDLLKAIEELSRKFTTDRAKISDYLKDERLASAYTTFYLLTNIPKLSAIMKWMPEEWIRDIRECSLVDLGAGPGTFSLAWKELFGGTDFLQVETSPVMRKQARKLWDGIHPSHEMKQEGSAPEKSILLFGHSANEMGEEAALHYIEKYSPEHILFIEPGTKEFFGKMLNIRRALLASGHHILYPCPEETECPMKGTDNWCHQFVHVSHDPEVERLSQMMKLDRKLLPLTVQAFSRKVYPRVEERLVRVYPETKFSFEWQVCHNNHLQDYQVMKRGMDKSTEKEIANLLSGAGLHTEIEKEMPEKKRVKLRR